MRLRTIATTVASGAAVAGLAIAGAVGAAPAGSGASVVAQQDDVTTHSVCANDDVYFAASGFAPNRKTVFVRVQIVGAAPDNPLFAGTINLVDGAGSVNTGSPGPDLVGAKFRIRYQTGSSAHPVNHGAFSGTIVDC